MATEKEDTGELDDTGFDAGELDESFFDDVESNPSLSSAPSPAVWNNNKPVLESTLEDDGEASGNSS